MFCLEARFSTSLIVFVTRNKLTWPAMFAFDSLDVLFTFRVKPLLFALLFVFVPTWATCHP